MRASALAFVQSRPAPRAFRNGGLGGATLSGRAGVNAGERSLRRALVGLFAESGARPLKWNASAPYRWRAYGIRKRIMSSERIRLIEELNNAVATWEGEGGATAPAPDAEACDSVHTPVRKRRKVRRRLSGRGGVNAHVNVYD